jgi:hypothetical protein
MARLFSPAFNQQFFDENGKPLSAGKLYTYVAGSSTPVTTYKSITGSELNTNPIILDAAGYADFVLELGASYKFVLKDKNDVFKKQWDNVTSADISSVIDDLVTDIEGKADRANPSTNGNLAELDAYGNVKDSHHKISDFVLRKEDLIPIEESIAEIGEELEKKMDIRQDAEENNFVSFDENGNSKDSGYNPSSFYQLPEGGIPKADLSESVQDSLDLADTSLQPSDLNRVVRVDAQQNFSVDKKKQGRDNISAQKLIGGPGAFIDYGSSDASNQWALIGTIDLQSLGIYSSGSLASYYTNISLSLLLSVYETSNTDNSVVEQGRFDINVHVNPSDNVWNYNAQWSSYTCSKDGSHKIELARVSKKMGTGSDVKSFSLFVKLPVESSFYKNSLSVAVINNYGCTHRKDLGPNASKSFVSPWNLQLGFVYENYTFGMAEHPTPIGKYISQNFDSYKDFYTRTQQAFSVIGLNDSSADSDWAFTDGNIPLAKYDTDRICYPVSRMSDKQFIAMYDIRMLQLVKTNGGYQSKFNGAFKISNHGYVGQVSEQTPVLLCKLFAGGRTDINVWVYWSVVNNKLNFDVRLSVGDYNPSAQTEITKEIYGMSRYQSWEGNTNYITHENHVHETLSNKSLKSISGATGTEHLATSFFEATIFGVTNKITGDEADCYRIRVVRDAIKSATSGSFYFYGEIELMIPQLGF